MSNSLFENSKKKRTQISMALGSNACIGYSRDDP